MRRYFELQGYFVRTNVKYEYRTPKGMGWSDIDLCILHPLTGDAAAVEVKGWHMESITPSYFRDWPSILYFTRDEAKRAVADLLGREDFRSIVTVSRVGPRGSCEVLAKAAEARVEILEFRTVLDYLIEHVPRNRDAGSESEHVILRLRWFSSPLTRT